MNESDIVCVATTPDQARAHEWRSALEAEGIECQVGEYLTFWFDNMPWAQADVWVHRANAYRARAILEQHATAEASMIEPAGVY